MANDERRPADTSAPASPAVNADIRNANAVIPREALERVLARAVELQTVREELPDGISEARLVEIGREVGIDITNLRQAMAEERARLPLSEEEHGFILDALGPGVAVAQRTVPGTPGEIMAKLEAWMPRMELLEKRRRVGEQVSWEPKRDPIGNFFRSMGSGGRQLDLLRADQVSAVVTSIDESKSVVHFESQMHGVRRNQRTMFVVLATLLSGAFFVVAVPVWLLATPGAVPVVAIATVGSVLAATGFGVWRAMQRGYRRLVGRAQLRLEQLLDDLETGGMQPRAPGLLHQVRDVLLGG